MSFDSEPYYPFHRRGSDSASAFEPLDDDTIYRRNAPMFEADDADADAEHPLLGREASRSSLPRGTGAFRTVDGDERGPIHGAPPRPGFFSRMLGGLRSGWNSFTSLFRGRQAPAAAAAEDPGPQTDADGVVDVPLHEPEPAQPAPRRGFFSRLFGRR